VTVLFINQSKKAQFQCRLPCSCIIVEPQVFVCT